LLFSSRPAPALRSTSVPDTTLFRSPTLYSGAGTGDSHQCTFDDNGTYTVKARIFDKDNGYTTYSTDVVVNNVPPSVTAAAGQSSDGRAKDSIALAFVSGTATHDKP